MTDLKPTLAALMILAAPAAMADQVINDDLIVFGFQGNGGACIGANCVDGVEFGFATLLIDAPDPSILFADTSNSGSFPTNDWQVGVNGGDGSFYIQDVDGSANVLTIAASGEAIVLGSGGTLEDGTISVSGLRVSNVADGIEDTDAVTLRQLNAALVLASAGVADMVAANTTQLAAFGREIDDVGAIGSAMSALQMNPRGEGDHFLSVGLGHYSGSTAFAVGSFHFLAGDTIFVNTGISRAINGEGGTAARLGFTFGG